MSTSGALDSLVFDNRFTTELPADPSSDPTSRQVHDAAFSRVMPKPTSAPRLIAHSPEVADLLGLSADAVASPEFAAVMSGNHVLAGMDPYAAAYGGHQFGNWAGQLGDGRAIALGEVITPSGQRQTLQLKGAGPTPYSRMADGLAVLRSSVREFLCSEAMFHLGVPTTRALSLCLTGDKVLRDMFYDGRSGYEPGAVVCRVAPSFIRFGNFELFASREEHDLLKRLADHTITHHFPQFDLNAPTVYADWFGEVVERTAQMIIHWQRVGFVHGVMNTDNLSIHGLTIDYGPYGWLEDYDPGWTPNTTDASHRRYRFGNQPAIAQWNLMQLANALFPLVGGADPLQDALERFVQVFNSGWQEMMNAKLGFGPVAGEADHDLVVDLLQLLPRVETDMSIFFRQLPMVSLDTGVDDQALVAPLREAYYQPETLAGDIRTDTVAWLRRYQTRAADSGMSVGQRAASMNSVNPKYVLRNYLAQLAIDEAENENKFDLINELLDVLRNPYTDQPGKERFAEKRPEWARNRPGCSQLSCSS